MEKDILLHLSLIDGVGPVAIKKLIETCAKNNQSLSECYQFSARDFIKRAGFTQSQAKSCVKGLSDCTLLDKEREQIVAHKVRLITLVDDDYPPLLKTIYAPPPVLYCIGAPLASQSRRVAFVGSRKATAYARRVTTSLVGPLIANGWEIVSGGARGADTMAHQAALDAGGKTIVVFGAGLRHPYPKENTQLFRNIVKKGGTLVSCFPLNTPPSKGLFPARNRVIAGLSDTCVVLQAAEKSGALITASFALEQGRTVCAVPGNIDEELSVGCHRLLQQGAVLVTSAQDIAVEFGETCATVDKEYKSNEPSVRVGSPEEKIFNALDKAQTLDDLMVATELPFEELQQLLFSMQLAGTIQQNFVGMWERNN